MPYTANGLGIIGLGMFCSRYSPALYGRQAFLNDEIKYGNVSGAVRWWKQDASICRKKRRCCKTPKPCCDRPGLNNGCAVGNCGVGIVGVGGCGVGIVADNTIVSSCNTKTTVADCNCEPAKFDSCPKTCGSACERRPTVCYAEKYVKASPKLNCQPANFATCPKTCGSACEARPTVCYADDYVAAAPKKPCEPAKFTTCGQPPRAPCVDAVACERSTFRAVGCGNEAIGCATPRIVNAVGPRCGTKPCNVNCETRPCVNFVDETPQDEWVCNKCDSSCSSSCSSDSSCDDDHHHQQGAVSKQQQVKKNTNFESANNFTPTLNYQKFKSQPKSSSQEIELQRKRTQLKSTESIPNLREKLSSLQEEEEFNRFSERARTITALGIDDDDAEEDSSSDSQSIHKIAQEADEE